MTGTYHIIAAFSEDAQNFLIDEGGTGEVSLQIEEVLPAEIGITDATQSVIVFLAVSLTAPSASAVVSNDLVMTASAAGAVSVIFLVDGSEVGESLMSPFSVTIDSNLFSDGMHRLQAAARGASGQLAYSPPVIVSVQNVGVPVLSGTILTPASIRLDWTAARGAAGYKISQDDSVTDVGNVLTLTAASLAPGTHSFKVKSYNTGGFESAFSNEIAVAPTAIQVLYDTATGALLYDTATGAVLKD